MKTIPTAVLLSLASFWISCSGSETGNPAKPDTPLSHFEASACKTQTPTAESPPGTSQAALVTSSDYDGLECVEWETSATNVTVRLLNFQGGCGVKWDGRAARRADGSVDLVLVNSGCTVNRCGSCLYDSRFDLSGVAAAAPLGLHVEFADCADAGVRPAYDTTVPLDTAPSGIVCRYAALGSVLSTTKCKAKNLQCGGDLCSMPCADNLECTAVAAGDSRCLLPCATDADCQPMGTTTCQDGVCKLATTF